MKKPGSIFLALFLFIPGVCPVQAQSPVIFAPDTAVTCGASFSLPVKVHHFNDITGLQFILSWDSTLLRYEGIERPALDIEPQKHFGTTAVSAGLLRFLWFEESLAPVSMPDSSTLFRLRFVCIARQAADTPVAFASDELTKIEIYDGEHRRTDAQFEDALLSIDQTTARNRIAGTGHIRQVSSHPNPFSRSTNISFTLDRGGRTLLTLYDFSGKEIYAATMNLGKGRHQTALPARRFPAPGAYLCRIQSAGHSVYQKLIFK